jgi:membrane associated rhomboid family serine protease
MNYYSPTGFKLMPPVVKNLLIINVILYLATIVVQAKFNYDLTGILGLFYFASPHFQPFQLITYMFMHGSFMHIFSNMFALWMFGAAIENYWGSKRFAYFYFLTGIGAAGFQFLINYYHFHGLEHAIIAYKNAASPESFTYLVVKHFPEYQLQLNDFITAWSHTRNDTSFAMESFRFVDQQYLMLLNIPTVGASGAIFGLLLAFGMLFPNSMIYLYFFVPIKAKYFVILYGVFELYSGISSQPGDNIAHFAHLGGMIIGFVLIKFWQHKHKI